MIGSSLGHFDITAKVGEGGMGEVYRATDRRLNREVAIKVLPEMFASDEERMGRFEREAQVLASLSHPNIASIFGIEESEGAKALVMELVEGEDLSDRLARGPLSPEEAARIAVQIAAALESAHDGGVVHRDLKPANVKLTDDGIAKVLDFGLGKALEGDATSSPDLTQSVQGNFLGGLGGINLGLVVFDDYAVDPDDQSFAFFSGDDEASRRHHATFVLNWLDELNELFERP